MNGRTELVQALTAITAVRRDYQDALDAHVSTKLQAPSNGDEQDEQSLASIARLLGEAAKAIRDAVSCADQLAARKAV